MKQFLPAGLISSILMGFALLSNPSSAQENSTIIPSYCQAVAENQRQKELNGGWPGIEQAALQSDVIWKASTTAAIQASEVKISYFAHSTFRIEDAEGLTIATDFAGLAGRNIIPEVVTMNHAHSTHFTSSPDPRIEHVLRGWGTDGTPAKHYKQIGNALIRNVTTDINSQWSGFEANGNSIFIFELAGLCIGHLGHLHHLPTESQYAAIGRLDIVMVPVDGGYTLSVKGMADVVKRLRASIVLPMHWFGQFSLGQFLAEIEKGFPVETRSESEITVSLNTLPVEPTIIVLQPESSFGSNYFD